MNTALLYDILFLLPFTITVSSFAHTYVEPDEMNIAWAVITCLVTIFLALFKHFKFRGKAILGGIFITLMLAIMVIVPATDRFDVIKDYLWVLWDILIAVAGFLTENIISRYKKVRLFVSCIGLISLIVLLLDRFDVSNISVLMIFVYALFTLTDQIQLHSDKEGDIDRKIHLTSIAPFILALMLPIFVIKVPDKPYDWQFVKNIGRFVKSEYIYITENFFTKNKWDSGNPVIGFSDRAGVNGDLKGGSRDVMEISSLSDGDPKLYLAGKIFDTFDGRDWQKTDDSTVDGHLLDTIETMSAILDKKGDAPLYDLAKRCKLTVEYKDMHTLCLFVPAKCMPVVSENTIINSEGGDYVFARKKYSNAPYDIEYYRINKDSDFFAELAVGPHTVDENSWNNAKKQCGILDSYPGYSDYLTYRNEIFSDYLSAPELSPKLKSYMDDLLESADSDYEKLRRIEGMFGSFVYKTNPGDLPDSIKNGSQYLDYFIFQKQEGYCSHFATSFVLLARAYGIPARYVQGYALPFGKNKSVTVSSTRGHAWPEAYIDGIGWIAFEPTPGHQSSVSWATSAEAEEYAQRYGTAVTPPVVTPPEKEDPESEGFSFHWYQVWIPVSSGLAFTLLLLAVNLLIRKIRYHRMNERKKAAFLCKSSLDLLKRLHLGIKDDETLSEYASRISFDVPIEKLAFIKIYEEILYSDRDISETDRRTLESAYKELRHLRRAR